MELEKEWLLEIKTKLFQRGVLINILRIVGNIKIYL